MANKLKTLKIDLKKWNEEEFGKVETNKQKDDLSKLDTLEESQQLTAVELLEKDWI